MLARMMVPAVALVDAAPPAVAVTPVAMVAAAVGCGWCLVCAPEIKP